MNKKSILLAVCALLSFNTIGLAYAEEKIGQDEAISMLTGNTVEGKIVKWGTAYKMYLHPSGRLVRLDSKGNVEKGMWRINDSGKFCIEFGAEKCRTIKKRKDGGLNLYNRQGDLKLTIDKVIPGNPNNWLP